MHIDELEPNEVALKEAIQPDTYIALRSPANSFELFFLFYVKDCVTADKDSTDDYGHKVLNGQQYFTGYYLEKNGETKKYVKYKELKKKTAFCVANEVQNIFVQIDRKTLRLPKEEYVAMNAYSFSNGRTC